MKLMRLELIHEVSFPAYVASRSSSSTMTNDTLARLRNDFRDAFHSYLQEGERMASLLRADDNGAADDRARAIREQQTVLNVALRRYEEARQRYVDGVMGQLAEVGAARSTVQ